MATHDYVIANGTGAAVRADLNNALAAIVSNNSGTSEPATTYAYQWWADTTNNLLKLRNSANNAWITLRELDGTLLMEDGSNSAPGLSFASDTNTGFFSGGADKIGFATGGVERLEIGSSEVVFNDPSNDVDFRVESNGQTHMLFVDAGNDRIGIGTSSPARSCEIVGGTSGAEAILLQLRSNFAADNTASVLRFGNSSSSDTVTGSSEIVGIRGSSGSSLAFKTQSGGTLSEAARIDSSGRLLVGTSSTSSNNLLVIAGTDGGNPGFIHLQTKSTTPGSTDQIGGFNFGTANDTAAARIIAYRDSGTWTPGSSTPTALTFNTTANGSSSPTERVRIDSSGSVGIGSNAPLARLEVSDDAQSDVTAGDLIVDTTGLSADVIVGRLSGRSNDNTTFRVRDRVNNSLLGSSTSVPFSVGTGGTERIRLDSSGRLLLGTSTGQSASGHTPNLQVSGTDFSSATVSITNNANSSNGSYLFFCKQRSGSPGGSTVLQANDLIGQLRWVGGDGTDMNSLAATIDVKVDGTPGSNDMPGRMVFSTTADGASSPTERVRITEKGEFQINTITGSNNNFQQIARDAGNSSETFTAINMGMNDNFTGMINISIGGTSDLNTYGGALIYWYMPRGGNSVIHQTIVTPFKGSAVTTFSVSVSTNSLVVTKDSDVGVFVTVIGGGGGSIF